jgi:hypothetical protein
MHDPIEILILFTFVKLEGRMTVKYWAALVLLLPRGQGVQLYIVPQPRLRASPRSDRNLFV